MKKFIGVATKYFDKSGNAYFSGYVLNCETEERIILDYQYGYGNHYQDVSLKEMLAKGWIEWNDSLHLYERENGYPIEWVEVNVSKKSDMIKVSK